MPEDPPADETPAAKTLDPVEVLNLLPHRYPFLLVDKVLDYEIGETIVAVKNVSWNEPFFEGHFPGNPIMPGVLQIEALAQAAALLGFLTQPELKASGGGVVLMGLDKVRFRRKVVPGDQLRLEVEVIKKRGPTWRVDARASVNGERAAQALILAAFVDGSVAG